MAEHIHKTYSCDRCGADLGEKLPNHSQKTDVTANFAWRDGPGPTFRWKDLCVACRAAVFDFFQPNDWERKK